MGRKVGLTSFKILSILNIFRFYISRLTRKTVITANTQFMSAKYHPTGVQVLTCGTDGRIGYWMVYNGSLVREISGSNKLSVNFLAINTTGDYFVSVDSDFNVKVSKNILLKVLKLNFLYYSSFSFGTTTAVTW